MGVSSSSVGTAFTMPLRHGFIRSRGLTKMKLCFVSHVSFTTDGRRYYCTPGFAKLMEMVAPLYDEVVLCAPLFDNPIPKGDSAMEVENLRLHALPPYFGRWEMVALLKPALLMRVLWHPIRQADAVLINVPNYMGIWACLICMLQRRRYALRIAGNWPEYMRQALVGKGYPRIAWAVWVCHEVLLRTLVNYSATTLAHGNEIAERYGRDSDKVTLVVSSTIHQADMATEVAGSGSGVKVVLYVGRLINGKGLDDLLDAAARLREHGLLFRLRLVGDGTQRERLQRQVEQLRLAERTEFLGWVPIEQLQSIYRSSDVFVFPSHSETGPKVVIESMANGLPVVVTCVGSVPSTMLPGRTGFVVPIGDVGGIANSIETILRDESLRVRMGLECLVRARQFTLEGERDIVGQALRRGRLLDTRGEEDE